jgi:hypothetical protein
VVLYAGMVLVAGIYRFGASACVIGLNIISHKLEDVKGRVRVGWRTF